MRTFKLISISTPPRYLLRDLWHGEDLQEVKVGKDKLKSPVVAKKEMRIRIT